MPNIDQDCAMQHIAAFYRQARNNEKADLAETCQTCMHNRECLESGKFDWNVKIGRALPDSAVKFNLARQARPDK